MHRFIPTMMAAPVRTAGLALTMLATSACSSADKAPDSAKAAAPAATSTPGAVAMSPSDSMAGMKSGQNMPGMGSMAMTGDPDHDFLRMMSDHHVGMIHMAHLTKDRKEGGMSAADATKIDTKQDDELDKMVTMLEQEYKDAYVPKIMPDNQAMADELKGTSGADYDRTFYQNVIKHHEQAVKMVDEFLPQLKSAPLKKMAEMMKSDQTKEIAEFQKKIAKMK